MQLIKRARVKTKALDKIDKLKIDSNPVYTTGKGSIDLKSLNTIAVTTWWLGLGLCKIKRNLSFPKIQSKHRQVISSKFPKNSRGADDLVVFYYFSDFQGFFPTFKSWPSITKSPEPLKLIGSLLEITWRCSDEILREMEGFFFSTVLLMSK